MVNIMANKREELIKRLEALIEDTEWSDTVDLSPQDAKDILGLLKEQKWISVKDKLPKAESGFFGTPYIVLTKNKSVIPLWFTEKIIRGTWVRRWEYYGGQIFHGEVVAWAPMPNPPKDSEHE